MKNKDFPFLLVLMFMGGSEEHLKPHATHHSVLICGWVKHPISTSFSSFFHIVSMGFPPNKRNNSVTRTRRRAPFPGAGLSQQVFDRLFDEVTWELQQKLDPWAKQI